MLWNYLFENMTDVVFFSTYIATAGLITGMSIKRIFFKNETGSPIIESPTSSGGDTLRALTSSTAQPSPTLHHFLLTN